MTINKKPEYILNPNYEADSPIPISHYLICDDKDSFLGPGMTKDERKKFWDKIWKDKSIPELP